MPFQRYKPFKQFGRFNTRFFKIIHRNKLRERLPVFRIPQVLQTGVEINDPNNPNFLNPKPLAKVPNHPAFRVPSIEEHPLYKTVECELFDGTIPFTDGIDQACVLAKAVRRNEFPQTILQKGVSLTAPNDLKEMLSELILRGERFDPTLEKLPRRFDPILFWYPHPRMHGTPTVKRGNIILENLFRKIVLTALQNDELAYLRNDMDEPLSCTIEIEDRATPLVIRSQPHLIVQSPFHIKPWAHRSLVEATRQENVPDVTPIDPRIDLQRDHIYNDSSVLPRLSFPLHLDTVMWTREQDQKYPWTREQNAANAVMFCFGAAVAEAMRQKPLKPQVLEKPIVTRAIQLVKGMMDFVVFQLNTLDFANKENDIKNLVWIEHAQRLYKPGLHDVNYDTVVDLNVETFCKMAGLLLTR